MKITTESGFSCEVNENALDDMRVFEALITMDEDGTAAFDKLKATLFVLTNILGEKGKDSLYKFIEEREGRAGTKAVSAMIVEIFNEMGSNAKKNLPSPE